MATRTSGVRRRPLPPRPACCSGCRRCALPDPALDVAAVVDEVDAALRAAATPGRAEQEKQYLKSSLEHLGTSMPAIRRVVLDVVRRHGPLEHDDVVAIADRLWQVPVHERRAAAAELLEARVSLLTGADLPLLERLIRDSRTWALVDPLAASVAGVVVHRERRAARTLDRWQHDEDFWVRRAALLALLPGVRLGEPDVDRIERFCDALLDEKEFFIRKAIGWLLRELGRHDPDRVERFLEPRLARTSGVTFREAAKPLDPSVRDRLAAARARTA